MPVPLQVLTTAGFLATSTFQRALAVRSGISKPTFSRVMPYVLVGIIGLSQQYIKFPYMVGEQANKKAQFVAMSGFPNVINASDCTYVAIKAPSENELGRHRCPPPPPSPLHSGGRFSSSGVSSGWPVSPPVVQRPACVTTDAFLLPLLCPITFFSLQPHSNLLRQ